MDNRSNEYISEALKIADDLMELANDEAGLADEGGFGILFAVCRDCAYKIRRHAEQEGRKAKIAWANSNAILAIFTATLLSIVFASPVGAGTIILSTDVTTETLGGLTFRNGDLAEYNTSTNTATLYFNEDLFTGDAEIDAVHVLANGNIILSTADTATLGGLSFEDGDLIEYNPTTGTATLFFSESLFVGDENIDAVHILDSGNIILSIHENNGRLGGMNFGYGDLIEYNPTSDIATMFLDGSLFSSKADIDAAYILANDNIILSTVDAATLGGLSFVDGDLVEYNPTTDIATLYFNEGLFSDDADVDAVYVTALPEPTTIALLGLGSLVLIGRRRG